MWAYNIVINVIYDKYFKVWNNLNPKAYIYGIYLNWSLIFLDVVVICIYLKFQFRMMLQYLFEIFTWSRIYFNDHYTSAYIH